MIFCFEAALFSATELFAIALYLYKHTVISEVILSSPISTFDRATISLSPSLMHGIIEFGYKVSV